jgi:type I restriction enzyme M protein
LTSLAPTKKTELLFLALFIRSLQLGGRCASIVPDGVLFGNSAGHQAIRKELVDNQKLQAVISMPSGVFLPYAGVSTAVLIFTKTNTGGTDKVWFYDMKADGFTLDQRRSPCLENDIPDIVERYNHLDREWERSRKEQSFLVTVDEIRDNNYDLSISKYKESEKQEIVYEDPDTILSRLLELQKEAIKATKEFKKLI